MLKRNVILMPITFLLYLFAHAQTVMENNSATEKTLLPVSPTATMFNIFGQIPVSHYTGTPDINIALAKVGFKELNLNLDLKYHNAIGTKPDAIPGYFGNGWLLTTGGMITRLSKGVRTFEMPNPSPVPNEDIRSLTDWSSTTRLNNYRNDATQFYDEGGRLDEFSFEFLGFSGKFYTDHTGKKKVKTSAGEDLLVEVEVSSSKVFTLPLETQSAQRDYSTMSQYSNITSQRQFIYKFTITDSRGVKYIFGGQDNAIDLVRPGLLYNGYDLSGALTLPTNWHLTSIISTNGYKIEFEYERGAFYITSEALVDCKQVSHRQMANPIILDWPYKKIKSTLYNPCYLKKIKTPVSYVQFYWSPANQQLNYSYAPFNPVSTPGVPVGITPDENNPAYFCKYPDIVNASMDNRYSQKLDSFILFDNLDNKRQRVLLNYTNNTATRLKLLSVKVNGPGATDDKATQYNFSYNALALPAYRSFNIDKFGFYNGVHTFMNSADPNYYLNMFINQVTRDAYLLSREPDSNYTNAEILEKVTYPTGGYTVYEYENNKYGRYAKSWPQSITENSGNQILTAGGLRIKTIKNYDGLGQTTGKKTYYYSKNFPDTSVSSGVLSYMPKFYYRFKGVTTVRPTVPVTADTLTYLRFGSNPINPAGHNRGSIITYSEVAEVDANKGYKIFSFKNYDNGFHDRPAENMVSDNSNVADFWEEDEVNYLDQERGQVLSEKTYDNTSFLIKKTVYKYDTTVTRFNNNVRMLKCSPNDIFHPNFPSLRYVAFLQYTNYPYQKSKEDFQYSRNGDSIVTIANFTYDTAYKILKETNVTGSSNLVSTEYLKYPFDHVRAGDTVPYAEMVRRNMVHLLTDKEISANGTFINKELTTYAKGLALNNNLILPYKKLTVYPAQDTMLLQVNNNYDTIGNLLWQVNAQNIHTSLVWGYGGLVPVAEVVNADYPTVRTALGGATAVSVFSAKSNPSQQQVQTYLQPLRSNSALSAGRVSTFISDPIAGLLTKEDENGNRSYFEYDYLMRLSLERDKDSNVVKKYGYKMYNQPDPVSGFYSDSVTRVFRKSNCGIMQIGNPVSVTLPAGFRFSYISKSDANAKALQYLLAYGPALADTTTSGGCSLYSGPIYILPKFTNLEVDIDGSTYADVSVEFYADPSFTAPISIPDTFLAYSMISNCIGGLPINPIYDTVLVNGRSKYLTRGMLTMAIPGPFTCQWVWENGQWVEKCLYSEPEYCPLSWAFSFANAPGGGNPEPPGQGVFKLGSVYAKVTIENVLTDMGGTSYGDVVLTFYSDAACTIPTNVSNLGIDYLFPDNCNSGPVPGGHITANGGSYVFSTVMVGYITPPAQQCNITPTLLSW